MEMLTHIRRAYQDPGKGSRVGLSLPKLSENSRCWGSLDPASSPDLLRHRTNRQRSKTVVPQSSSCSRFFAAAQLSHSAPNIMEPLLHNQTRLFSHETTLERKGFLPALHPSVPPHTPKRLAPLENGSRHSVALPFFKHHIPLQPINRSSLSPKTRLRRERSTCSSPRFGPVSIKHGSEESGSSSSSTQSSIDLEDETKEDERDVDKKSLELSLWKPSEDGLLKQLKDGLSTEAHTDYQLAKTQQNINVFTHKRLSCPFRHIQCGAPITHSDSRETSDINFEQNQDTVHAIKDTVNNDISIASDFKEKKINTVCTNETDGNTFTVNPEQHVAEENHISDLYNVEEEKRAGTNSSDHKMTSIYKLHVDQLVTDCVDGGQLNIINEENHIAPAVNFTLRGVAAHRDKRILKPSKRVPNKVIINSVNVIKTNIQSNKSFNISAHKEKNHKCKNNLRTSSVSTQVSTKPKKSPEPKVSGDAGSHDTPSPKTKVTEVHHPHSKNANCDKLIKSAKEQPAVTEMKSVQQLDFITYKDMFQEIQSPDERPAIYEIFVGPVYENLRVFDSCDKFRGRHVNSAPIKNTKVKHVPVKQPEKSKRRSPVETTVASSKSKPKLVSSNMKSRLTPVPRKSKNKTDTPNLDWNREEEFLLSQDREIYLNNPQEGNHMLSIIDEAPLRYESETLKPGNQTIVVTARQCHAVNSVGTKTQTGTQNQLVHEGAACDSPQQRKINTWTSVSSSDDTMSPVYQRFLDEVGDGPLTDDLLQCLAEELISLDERDVSTGPRSDNLEMNQKEPSREDGPLLDKNTIAKVNLTNNPTIHGCGSSMDEAIAWTKGEVLGRGAYGTVYCGLTNQGQLIAVKQVNLDNSNREAAEREYNCLQEEVELLKTLTHTNIVSFLGTSLYQHVVSIFMEYIPGGSIASVLHRFGPLPERILVLYTHQIVEGVAYLHQNRVVHRDLKGNNVMLMPTGVIKLIDFGCARRLSYLSHTDSNSGDLLKSVHGTPYWIAPEVINDTGYGRKSDIWSVGCTVFEMATGKPPLAHMNKMAALFYIGAGRGSMPSLPDKFSYKAKDFVRNCLTSDQRLRPSADQLLKHSFIFGHKAGGSAWETQIKQCCDHPEGLCV
ncbi:mitogen-activated protein kinase kinase kinase 19 isoform X2 [Thalassophryne amazonica]|uniref:mitogen-activated protein kinase kinase kinase 19 isoform X2 n=1 Tax=Thalassophryne amazonica TaxID=390379 RepID=UPI001471D6D2|nr:mitogen-activated protein kinase kinase kinase 19 isoform X2 [Thalassophryne amazonica]